MKKQLKLFDIEPISYYFPVCQNCKYSIRIKRLNYMNIPTIYWFCTNEKEIIKFNKVCDRLICKKTGYVIIKPEHNACKRYKYEINND